MPTSIAVISCEVFEIELKQLLATRSHIKRMDLIDWGLHNEPKKMPAALQAKIAEVETDLAIEAIMLGYGVCSRGTEGVVAGRCPIVIPRAHDCITVLLGSKERYAEYVASHPGTYWYSPGWNKHHLAPGKGRYDALRAQYVEKFGEDDADYLMEQEQAWFGATAADRAYTRECADFLGWQYDEQQGDPKLLQNLLDGPWDAERFLVVPPGQQIRFTADERIVEAV